ncbi:MAG TPA: Crp/Fnr family transcriptional regulator [Chitinophaga sp.]|uniref:Crp/Fnr family transcriptional regulator n=1 Tax=Chitinophaga sp. TaxID=1869181 RepID=UPI002CE161DA|nr:Crp/Fnr family transcriptional regulator [Chitinophaga sp.]HVI45838.1 Crp/Fnr family transcriptional regulator [Chitinophaga sp.]
MFYAKEAHHYGVELYKREQTGNFGQKNSGYIMVTANEAQQQEQMHQLHQFLRQQVNITDEDWRIFSSRFEYKVYPAGAFYLKAGEIENYVTFVDRGLVRFYVEDAGGNEVTCGFGFEGWFMCVYSSFYTRNPSRYYGETLTETHVWRIHYNDMQRAFDQLKVAERIGRLATEQMLMIKSERELSFLIKSAEERYLDLIGKAPHLFKYVPLKHLASYIGVTPQALSRIRKRIS